MKAGIRAIIIGGGIGGVTAAAALSRRGISSTVYERAAAPAEVGAGISIWGNAIKCLHRIDAAGEVLAAGQAIANAEVCRADGKVFASMNVAAADEALGAPSVVIHRAELLDALLAHAPPGSVKFGHTFVSYEEDAAGVTARFAGGQTDRADILIGADGINSTVRAQLLADGPPRYAGYTSWRGVTQFTGSGKVVPGYVAEFWGRGQRFGITFIGPERVYWWAALNSPSLREGAGGREAASDSASDTKAFLTNIFRDWFEPIPALIAATPAEAIIRHDISDRDPVPTISSATRGGGGGAGLSGHGRVILIGDAAHPTTPNIGQGGCVAIEDGFILARLLAEQSPFADIRAAAAEFERLRFPRTASITRLSRRLGRIGQMENPLACAIRDLLASLTPRSFAPKQHRRIVGYEA